MIIIINGREVGVGLSPWTPYSKREIKLKFKNENTSVVSNQTKVPNCYVFVPGLGRLCHKYRKKYQIQILLMNSKIIKMVSIFYSSITLSNIFTQLVLDCKSVMPKGVARRGAGGGSCTRLRF